MSTTASKVLAEIVLKGMQLREQSYDHKEADQANADNEVKRMGMEPKLQYLCVVDYAKFYKMTLHDACVAAAKELAHEELGFPAYLLSEYAWNDISDWAHEILGLPIPVHALDTDE